MASLIDDFRLRLGVLQSTIDNPGVALGILHSTINNHQSIERRKAYVKNIAR
jgi:hypothetical protein